MHDSCRLALDEMQRELQRLTRRLEDMERQVALAMERVKLLPDSTMPHRSYPARLNSNG